MLHGQVFNPGRPPTAVIYPVGGGGTLEHWQLQGDFAVWQWHTDIHMVYVPRMVLMSALFEAFISHCSCASSGLCPSVTCCKFTRRGSSAEQLK